MSATNSARTSATNPARMGATSLAREGVTFPMAVARAGASAAFIAGCVLFALVLFLPPILNDGDTLWQIRTGEWILDHHAIPATDPFSFTAGATPWYAHEWLAEVLMALAHRAGGQGGGMQGIMVLAASAVGVTAAVLTHHLRRFLPGRYALLGLILALSNAAPSMLARPHLLAWPCLVLWCGGLVAARARREAPSYALLPVMLLWVNLHGSFIVGLLLTGAFLVEALLDKDADLRRVFLAWSRFLLAAWAVALLNPDCVSGVLFPFHLTGMKSLAWIGEWQATDFSRVQPLELVILAFLALGLSGYLTLPPIRLLLFLGLIHGALAHGRNEQLLGLIGVLILAGPVGARLARGPAGPGGTVWRHAATGAAFLLTVLALTARLLLPLEPDRTGESFAAVLDRVPAALRAAPVLNEYGLGGALIFHGERPFVDSRADLYGDAFLTRYRAVTAPDRAELDQALAEYRIAWTIFPAGHRINVALDETPGWYRVLEADGLVVHAREEPVNR